MALFKYAGTKDELDQVAIHDGFVYVCSDGTDTDDGEEYSEGTNNLIGEWYVDIGSTRYRLAAAALIDPNGEVVSIEDLVQQGDILEVSQGGTGKASVTTNALLLGNNDGVMNELPATVGVLQVSENGGAPSYGVAPITMGGTGGATAAAARTNLEVYSKTETNTEVAKAMTTRMYNGTANITLQTGSGYWIEDTENERFIQTVTVKGLTCGPNNDLPPIIGIYDTMETSAETRAALEEAYALIYRAYANPYPPDTNYSTIQFIASERPEIEIPLIIVDNR